MRAVPAVALAVLSRLRSAKACTTFAMGSKATTDGSVIIAHSDDADPEADGRMLFVPAADHAPGKMRPVYNSDGEYPRVVSLDRGPDYEPSDLTDKVLGKGGVSLPIGHIPEVAHTYAYHDSDYAVLNEHNVGMAESTCSAMFRTCAKGTSIGCEPGRSVGEALFSIESLTELAMERTTTAREAVQLMGDLAVKYGFFGSQDPNGYGEALQVADPSEAWTFNILPDDTGSSAIWAAIRVPDDQVTVLANMFTLRGIDVNDTANCLASPNVYSIAQKYGWWKPGEVLDFTMTYSNGEYANKYYAGRRMWRGLSLAAPSLDLSPYYSDLKYDRAWPWSVKPDKLLTPQDVMGFYRDWYQGTEFDTSKGLAAGYGGSPDRFAVQSGGGWEVPGAWERTIGLYRTTLCFVTQLQKPSGSVPVGMAGVTWAATGPPLYTPFIPLPSGLNHSLPPLATIYPWKYLDTSLNWAARKVMTIAQVRWDRMHPRIDAKQKEVEDAGVKLLDEISPMSANISGIYDKLAKHAAGALSTWHELADDLVVTFTDNFELNSVNGEKGSHTPLGFPAPWLKGVGFQQGPPPVPPIRKGRCPNWDSSCTDVSVSKEVDTLLV